MFLIKILIFIVSLLLLVAYFSLVQIKVMSFIERYHKLNVPGYYVTFDRRV